MIAPLCKNSMPTIGMLLALVLLCAPCVAYAQDSNVRFYFPCRGSKAIAEGRTIDLVPHLNIDTKGMFTDDIEDRYCVTRQKCVALGFCKSGSLREQAEADKLNPDAAAERARLERERRQKEAQAERERQAAETERNRKAAAVAAETERLGGHREAEARRLVEMREAAANARGGTRTPGPSLSARSPAGQSDAATAARQRREAREAERAERERAEAEAKRKREEELRQHLAAERAGIRLRALKCGGQDTVTGIRPSVSPRIANCISVHYEARCPGVPQGQGTQMVFVNFVGGNSCYGDTQRLGSPLACKPETAIVDVRSVTVCW